MRSVLLLLFLAVDAAANESATLLISGDLQGYLEPCGCSMAMRGGISRLAYQIENAPDPKAYIDFGNSRYSFGEIPREMVPQADLKAKTIDSVFAMLKQRFPEKPTTFKIGSIQVSVATVKKEQELDLPDKKTWSIVFYQASMAETLKAVERAAHLPDVVVASAPNVEGEAEENKLVRGKTIVLQLQNKGRSLLRIDFSKAEENPRWIEESSNEEQQKEKESIGKRIEVLKAQVNEPGIDPQLKVLRSQKIAELVQRQNQVGSAHVADRKTNQSTFQVRFIPLESSMPQWPAAEEIVKKYNQAVGQLNVKWAQENKPTCSDQEPKIVGTQKCAQCHPAAKAVWDSTRHAHAYESLEHEGKNFHLDCIGCHVTGWQKPGGMCRIDKVDDRKGVGCENCHGPGSQHAQNPKAFLLKKEASASTCVSCHTHENSTHFDFSTFFPKIMGIGHGSK